MNALPRTIEGCGQVLADHLRDDRAQLRRLLRRHGALLLRGFDVGECAGLSAAVEALSGAPLEYTERSSPRRELSDGVYTSTEYPASEEIFWHNENSYQASWPMTLFFHCSRPAVTGGATPLADVRAVLAAISPDVVEEFARRRWQVTRTFREELGLSWRYVFGTSDRAEVEAHCRREGLEAQWLGPEVLRTRAVRDAVHTHPSTGERVWFNHVTVFHDSTLPAAVRAGLVEMVGPDEMPSTTAFGDGGAIQDDVVSHLRDCYRHCSVRFDYQRDDVLVVDNMLVAHGREPFVGPREVAVAMAEPSTQVVR